MNKQSLSPNTLLLFLAILFFQSVSGIDKKPAPVTKNAMPETKALLDLFYNISGQYLLTGQHNYPNVKDRNTQFAANYIGQTPVIFSTDMGFAKDGDTDSHLARPDIVAEAIRQHKLGAIITICWHAVPPTANEPVTFRPLPGASEDSLASVQGKLLDQQFIDLLTPGTSIYKHWCDQVDTIAKYLKQLQEAHVPILWRPYHEMNGDWFWWGGRTGKYSTVALYKQLYERLVNYHKLTNLIWVWSLDRPVRPGMEFSLFNPGSNYYDIAALDVYRNDFNQSYYDSMVIIAKGKPIVLGEVGNPPSSEIIKKQQKWAYFATWAGLVRNTSKNQYDSLKNNPHVLFMEDSAYQQVTSSYRAVCGLASLYSNQARNADFSGLWKYNESQSSPPLFGLRDVPYKIEIEQNMDTLSLKREYILEYIDNQVSSEKVIIDGKEYNLMEMDYPKVMTTNRSESGDSLLFKSIISMNWGGSTMEIISTENWALKNQGRTLVINRHSTSRWGEYNAVLIFDKQELF